MMTKQYIKAKVCSQWSRPLIKSLLADKTARDLPATSPAILDAREKNGYILRAMPIEKYVFDIDHKIVEKTIALHISLTT